MKDGKDWEGGILGNTNTHENVWVLSLVLLSR